MASVVGKGFEEMIFKGRGICASNTTGSPDLGQIRATKLDGGKVSTAEVIVNNPNSSWYCR